MNMKWKGDGEGLGLPRNDRESVANALNISDFGGHQ